MNTHDDKNPGDTASMIATTTRSHLARRWLIGATLLVAAAAAGSSFANGGTGLTDHFRHTVQIPADPAALAAHIDRMVEQCAPDASADQKARLAAIAQSALAELGPLKAQLGESHARAHALQMAPVVDRAALEQLRVEQMQRFDVLSRRMLVAVEDGADVLTPQQRARFAAQLKAHMRQDARMVQHVLMIEDDERLAGMVAIYLAPHGLQLSLATTARDGLAMLRQGGHGFALVLLDLMLPDGDGLEVCRQIRGLEHDI